MTSFQCKQCPQCNRYRNIQEEYNLWSVCNYCYIPKEEVKEVEKPQKDKTITRAKTNRKNPKAKEVFKQIEEMKQARKAKASTKCKKNIPQEKIEHLLFVYELKEIFEKEREIYKNIYRSDYYKDARLLLKAF